MKFGLIVFVFFICIFPQGVDLESKRCKSRGSMDGLPDGCEMNDSGYLCCSGALQETIMEAIDELKKEKEDTGEEFNNGNMHAMAWKIGKMAEKKFNTSFEVFVGLSNFASKTRFHGNFLCKVKAEEKVILSYGTPKKADPLESIPLPIPFRRRHYTFTYRV